MDGNRKASVSRRKDSHWVWREGRGRTKCLMIVSLFFLFEIGVMERGWTVELHLSEDGRRRGRMQRRGVGDRTPGLGTFEAEKGFRIL